MLLVVVYSELTCFCNISMSIFILNQHRGHNQISSIFQHYVVVACVCVLVCLQSNLYSFCCHSWSVIVAFVAGLFCLY